jgi:hypothetical protein
VLGVCHKCGINTFLSFDASGYGSCVPCGSGAHNPNPAKYARCVCKIGHEPDERFKSAADRTVVLTCSPCAVGYYKVQEADGMGTQCCFAKLLEPFSVCSRRCAVVPLCPLIAPALPAASCRLSLC